MQAEQRTELAELRARLREAEETLAAIRSGEVDALVVEGPGGRQTFTLHSADRPYRVMIEQMQEAAVTVSPDGLVIYCNRRLGDLVGRPISRIIGSFIWELLAEPDRPAMRQVLEAGEGAEWRGELNLLTADLTTIPVHVSASSLAIETERSFCLVITDLRQQRQHESLRDSEALFRAMAESMPQIVWMLHPGQERSMYFNQRWSELTGIDREDSSRWMEAMHPEERQALRSRWERSVATGQLFEIEHRVRTADGRYLWHLSRAVPMRSPEGHITRWLGTSTDIHGRKQAEDSLKRSRQELADRELQLRLALAAGQVGVLEIDLATGQISGGDTTAMLLDIDGLPYEQTINAHLRRVHPDDRQKLVDAIEASRNRGGEYAIEYRVMMRDGACRWLASRGQVFPERDGQPGRLVGAIVDISVRKQSEQRLKELNDSLEQRVAQRTAESQRRAEQLRKLTMELTRSEHAERHRLAKMLHDHLQQLLVAAKLKLGVAKLRGGPSDIGQSLTAVESLLDDSIQASRTLTVELAPPVLEERGLGAALHWLARHVNEKHALEVSVDARSENNPSTQDAAMFLFDAARELLFNVVKHAGTHLAHVELRRTGEDCICLSVRDEGVGFSVPVDSPEHSGTGLGLFSIQQRVELLGGSLNVHAIPGGGSRVTICLPDDAPATARPPRRVDRRTPGVPAEHREARPRLGIVLVDDHKIVRDGLVGLLREQPDLAVIGEAADGVEAIEVARELRPDVIVMDVSMPRMSGVEATRQIVAEQPDAKIIGLSMHEMQDMAQAMRDAGAVDFVTKGGPIEQLVAAIRTVGRRAS